MSMQEFIDKVSNLDPENIGSWPLPIKVICFVLIAFVVGFAVYQIKLSDSLELLQEKREKEVELMQEFEKKAFEASHLDKLKEQMKSMERTYSALVKQLPSDTEVPGLLEDISQIGVDSGLELSSIDLGNEKIVEFYAELPIKISATGGYHAFANFVSGVAALPRIVTLHDFLIVPHTNKGNTTLLSMTITAKIYRYNQREG